eukprot:6490944-Amphidinium_carterae.2
MGLYARVPCKEDVQKVVKQAGKVSQKAIVAMAAALESVAFWKERSDEYIRAAPAMLAEGHKLATYLHEVQVLPIELNSLSKLKPILQDLPQLNASLRAGCTTTLMEKCSEKLLTLWPVFKKAAEANVATCQLHEMVDVISAAGELFPLEGDIQEMQKECNTMQQKKGQEVLVARFEAAMVQCRDEVSKSQKPLADALSVLIDAVRNLKLPTLESATKTTLMSAAMGVMKLIFEDASKKLSTAPGDLACLTTFLNASKLMAEKLQDDSLEKQAHLLEVLQLALHCKALLDLKNRDQWLVEARETKFMDNLVGLKRALQKIDIAKKDVGQIEQCFLKQLDTCVASMDLKYKAMKIHMISESLSCVKSCHEQLAPHAQGGAEGKSWLEGFEGKTFASIQAHAESSLLKLDPVQYIGWQAKLDQA